MALFKKYLLISLSRILRGRQLNDIEFVKMVNVYPVENTGSLTGSVCGASPMPNSRHPKLRSKQNSILGNIFGPAFDSNPNQQQKPEDEPEE